MSVVALATSVTGLSANAQTPTTNPAEDQYSKFYYYKDNYAASCELTNRTTVNRYAQASMTVRTISNNYFFPSTSNSSLGYNQIVKAEYSGSYIISVDYSATLYTTQTPYGTPLSYWTKSL